MSSRGDVRLRAGRCTLVGFLQIILSGTTLTTSWLFLVLLRIGLCSVTITLHRVMLFAKLGLFGVF